MKLVNKESVGHRTRKLYNRPTTPLQRVLSSGKTDDTKVRALTDLYTWVSPLTLKRQIDRGLAAMTAGLEVSSTASTHFSPAAELVHPFARRQSSRCRYGVIPQ